MLVLTVVSLALAQSEPADVPQFDAQTWRMPIDASRTMWTDDSAAAPDRSVQARLVGGWVDRPVVFDWEDGDRVSLVTSAVHADAIASVQLKRLRVGFDAPVYLVARGDEDTGGGLGDIAMDVKGTLLDRGGERFGLALAGRLSAPTATVTGPLSLDGPAAEVRVIADRDVGRVLVAANVGTRVGPQAELVNVELNDEAFARLGAGWAVRDDWGLSADVAAETTYAAFLQGPSTPVEAMLGGWYRFDPEWTVRAGASTGLSRGIGSPVARTVLAVTWQPPVMRDSDLDGIGNRADACPTQGEDADLWQDEDGCPEPTEIVVRVVDAEGTAVPWVTTRLAGPGVEKEGATLISATGARGPYAYTARAVGWQPIDTILDVPDGPPQTFDLVMTPIPPAPPELVLAPSEVVPAATLETPEAP